jgi:hypothetical protein
MQQKGINLDSLLPGFVSKSCCEVAHGEMMGTSQRRIDSQDISTQGHCNLYLKATEDEHGVKFRFNEDSQIHST